MSIFSPLPRKAIMSQGQKNRSSQLQTTQSFLASKKKDISQKSPSLETRHSNIIKQPPLLSLVTPFYMIFLFPDARPSSGCPGFLFFPLPLQGSVEPAKPSCAFLPPIKLLFAQFSALSKLFLERDVVN